MTRYVLLMTPIFVVLACSSGSSSSGTGSPAGSPDGSPGPTGGPSTCSGVPADIVGSCSTYFGGDADAGTGGSLLFCIEYSGKDAVPATGQQACAAAGTLKGYYGVASSSPCPTANQLGGVCVQNCGGNLVLTTYQYTSGGLTASQVADMCKSPNDYVQ